MVLTGTASQSKNRSLARVAFVGLDSNDAMVLHDCLAHCGVNLAMAAVLQPARLEHERFESCVVKLVPGCEIFLDEIRRSPVNRNTVLIGASPPDSDLAPYWKYGFNAILHLPLELAPSVEALRTICLLTASHLRRYVRVPLATEVNAVADGIALKCISREISGGGLALRIPSEANDAKSWVLEFVLPGGMQVRISGITCWVRPAEHMLGVLFDPDNEQRHEVKKWIESFLAA
jgi:hypothetical protein